MTIKNKIKGAAILTAMALTLSGCKVGNSDIVFTTGVGSNDLFKINGKVCTMKEAKVYLINYQNIYGKSYGVDLWENTSCNEKLQKYVKELTVSELSKVVCMDFLAAEKNISLSDDEQSRVDKAAAAYYKSLTREEKKYTDASEGTIRELYSNYALAKKTYDTLTESVDKEVSDNEARVMHVMQVYVKQQEKADEVKAKLGEGMDFASVASNYNEATDIEITLSRGTMPEQVEEAAFELENGEISECIKADNGYYFIKCVNKFDEKLTDSNKVKIVEKREKEVFEDEYNVLIEGFSSSFNYDGWDAVELEKNEDIATDSFFDTFEQYYN